MSDTFFFFFFVSYLTTCNKYKFQVFFFWLVLLYCLCFCLCLFCFYLYGCFVCLFLGQMLIFSVESRQQWKKIKCSIWNFSKQKNRYAKCSLPYLDSECKRDSSRYKQAQSWSTSSWDNTLNVQKIVSNFKFSYSTARWHIDRVCERPLGDIYLVNLVSLYKHVNHPAKMSFC